MTLPRFENNVIVYNYTSYDEIDPIMSDYLVGVTSCKNLKDASLDDINSFLNGLVEFNEATECEYV